MFRFGGLLLNILLRSKESSAKSYQMLKKLFKYMKIIGSTAHEGPRQHTPKIVGRVIRLACCLFYCPAVTSYLLMYLLKILSASRECKEAQTRNKVQSPFPNL